MYEYRCILYSVLYIIMTWETPQCIVYLYNIHLMKCFKSLGLLVCVPKAQRPAYCEFFPAQTPAEGNLRTLLATSKMQSVRCADFGSVKPPTHTRHYNLIIVTIRN